MPWSAPGTTWMSERSVVIDASVLVDVLVGTRHATAARDSLAGVELHAPAHLDLEVLSALGRLHRADHLSGQEVADALHALATAPITRHPLSNLLGGAWARRRDLWLTDALYVELSASMALPLLTTDLRLARAHPTAITVESP